jgi:hypothetical protein
MTSATFFSTKQSNTLCAACAQRGNFPVGFQNDVVIEEATNWDDATLRCDACDARIVTTEEPSGVDLATGTTKAERDWRESITDEMMDMAMIAIFGRKAGLGWPVIVAAMGQTLSFTLRLRPVMKLIDPSSVAKLGPAYSAKEAR